MSINFVDAAAVIVKKNKEKRDRLGLVKREAVGAAANKR